MSELPAFRACGVDESSVVHIPNAINEEDYGEKGDAEFRVSIGVSEHPFILFYGASESDQGPRPTFEDVLQSKGSFPQHSSRLHRPRRRNAGYTSEDCFGAFAP